MSLEEKDGKVVATKNDNGKLRNLFPRRAYIEIQKVFNFGAEKYAVGNWHAGEGFDHSRLLDAMDRHYSAMLLGEDQDEESRLLHAAHLGCCVAMYIEHLVSGHGKDDRNRANYIPDFEVHKFSGMDADNQDWKNPDSLINKLRTGRSITSDEDYRPIGGRT